MPTRAGQRCGRQPCRLHRTASLRHESSVESSVESSNRTEDEGQNESEMGIAQPDFLGGLYDGTTPIIEETPGSDARSTPCPDQHDETAPQSVQHDQMTPRSVRSSWGVDMSMPDDFNGTEHLRRTPTPVTVQRRHHLFAWHGSEASSVERQALHNATVNNHQARLRANELEIEADRVRLAEMERMARLEDRADEATPKPDVLLIFLVLVEMLLLYACFCWFNWPEMSYIRKRRQEVLGM